MNLLRNGKLLLASLVLAVGGLGVATTATPAAHAASGPAITYVNDVGGGVQVQGDGCTPGVTARIVLLTPDLRTDLGIHYVTTYPAWNSDPGGFALLVTTSYVGPVSIALDCQPGPTAWASAYVYQAPHLRLSTYYDGGELLVAEGSGFTPGAQIAFYVYDSNWHYLGALDSTAGYGYGAGIADVQMAFHYSGYVHVLAGQVNTSTFSEWETIYY